ncbi:MAG: hypothetical protein ABR590_06140 [Spirochaetia bacterium]
MKKSSIVSSILLILTLAAVDLTAQDLYRIQNRWKPDDYIHVEQPVPDAGTIQPGWVSAQWVFEQVPGENYYRIRNKWRADSYLHVENGRLEAGQILPGWLSAQWSTERVEGSYIRIRNRWLTDQVIHNQNGRLAAGSAEPGWWSAQWVLSPVGAPAVSPIPSRNTEPAAQSAALPVNDMRLFRPRHNGTVGMVLVRYTNQIKTMMDLQIRRGDKIYFFPQRLPDANRDGISFNPDNPEIGGETFIVEESSPSITLDRPMPMIRNRRNDTFAFVVEVFR